MSDEPRQLAKILDFVDGKWKVVPDCIPDGENQPLAIVTSIGDFGVGKSFLNNVLLNFFRLDDFSFEDEALLLREFPTETSVESETKGIDMYKEYLSFRENVFENDAMLRKGNRQLTFFLYSSWKCENAYSIKKWSAAIWDTEGYCDPCRSQEHTNTIAGLSFFFSSVTILNIKEKFTTTNMDKMQVFLQTMRDCMNSSNEKVFQDLVIVIRDWRDARFAYCWEGGEDYKNFLFSEACPDGQAQAFFRELQHSFRNVHVFLMPVPNLEVQAKPSPVKTMADIHEPFKSSLLILVKQIVYGILEPRVISEEEITVGNLREKLIEMENTFANPPPDCTNTLANAIKQNRITKKLQTFFERYQSSLMQERGWFTREATRNQRHDELKRSTVDAFREAITDPFIEEQLINATVKQLTELIDERFRAYNDDAHYAQKVMWIVGGVVLGAAAVAVIICFPEVSGAVRAAISSPVTRKLIASAVPLITPMVKQAATGSFSSDQMPWSRALYAIVTAFIPNKQPIAC